MPNTSRLSRKCSELCPNKMGRKTDAGKLVNYLPLQIFSALNLDDSHMRLICLRKSTDGVRLASICSDPSVFWQESDQATGPNTVNLQLKVSALVVQKLPTNSYCYQLLSIRLNSAFIILN